MKTQSKRHARQPGSISVSVRLTPTEHQYLRKLASERGHSLSDAFRALIRDRYISGASRAIQPAGEP